MLTSGGGRMSGVGPDLSAAIADLEVIPAGRLMLPSGRLVATEPPGRFPAGEVDQWAFGDTVAPGEYQVEILRTPPRGMPVVARVVVRPDPVKLWEPATVVAHPEWEHFGFPVDGGIGGFGSVEAFEALTGDEAGQEFTAALMEGIRAFASQGAAPFFEYSEQKTGANVFAFMLAGDGVYETWVGRTAAGEVACFLTDYGRLAS